jgi:hypothetical protein
VVNITGEFRRGNSDCGDCYPTALLKELACRDLIGLSTTLRSVICFRSAQMLLINLAVADVIRFLQYATLSMDPTVWNGIYRRV